MARRAARKKTGRALQIDNGRALQTGPIIPELP
jgi:hypothetical protein